MLSHLAVADGQSQQALSIALGIHRTTMVALVDDLERRGLAERRRDPADRRAYTPHLTISGREPMAEAVRIAEADEDELLATLETPERSQLISLLQRMAQSQGLDAGVHPALQPQYGDPQSGVKDG